MVRGQGERGESDADSSFTWGLRLLALLSLSLAVTLAWMWIEKFYRGVDVNAQLSFAANDPSFMPPHSVAHAVIGQHFFGDYQLPWGYAQSIRHSVNPYLLDPPAAGIPSAMAFFLPFTFLPFRAGVFTYLILSIVTFLVPLALLLKPLRVEFRIIFLIPVAVVATPFITFVDRGNFVGLAAGLVAWTVWAWREKRWYWCCAFLVAAIALKQYPLILLIVPIALRQYKFSAIVAGSVAAINLLVLAVFPGGYIENFHAMVTATLSQQDWFTPADKLFSWSAFSVIPKSAGLIFGPSTAARMLDPNGLLLWLPSLLYLGGLYFIIRRRTVPQWCWGPLALASMQLILPLNFVYSTAWASLGAVWFAQGQLIDVEGEDAKAGDASQWLVLRIMVLLALIASLTPSVFKIQSIASAGYFTTPLAAYLSPMALLIAMCTAVGYSLRRPRATAPTPVAALAPTH